MTELSQLDKALDGQRFWDDVQELAAIGALSPQGIRRLTLDEQDNRARLWLAEQGLALGCQVFYDALGNLFLRREGQDPSLAPLLVGSHMDSQPQAGAYDGALGVLAGLALLRTLHEHDIPHRRPVEIVSWTNEEGSRFAPGASGSSWFAGRRTYDEIVSAVDGEDIRFADALAECLDLLEETEGMTFRPEPFVPHAFLELHIEQGPVLETLGKPIGVVSGIQGVNWYRVEVLGVANHAGTTPRQARRDAFDGAHELVTSLKATVLEQDDEVRFTIGKFALWPDSVNTIAQRAVFTIDLRHPHQAVLDALDERFHALAARQWSGCDVTLEVSSRVPPVDFPDALVKVLRDSAQRQCSEVPELVSGAFHDAIHLVHVCPTAMLFTPCRAGISHHPDEHIERDDAEISARVLAQAAGRLLS